MQPWGVFRPPPLLPGLPVVWSPMVVLGALGVELRALGLDPATLAGGYATALGLEARQGARHAVPCPGCGVFAFRLTWTPDGFRGRCCDGTRHRRNDGPGRHAFTYRGARRALFNQAADTLFAIRLGSGEAASRVERLAVKLARFAPDVRTVGQTVQFAVCAAVLRVPVPPPERGPRVPRAAGPLARALAGDRLDLLVHDAWSVSAYSARVRHELRAGGLTTIRVLE